MKYIKLFENFEDYDPYELMIMSPNKKAEMIIEEIKKEDKANLNLVRDLIQLGADLDCQREYGYSALHWCAFKNRPEIARILIDAGADVNVQDREGWTALHWCANYNRMEIANMLLDSGADKTIQDDGGKLPYELAYTQELKELLQP